MNCLYQTNLRVEFRDTDAAGMMHFSTFFTYMEQVEHEFLRRQGLSVLMHDSDGVLSWPRVAAHCEFRSAVRFEDELTCSLNIKRLGTSSVTWDFRFEHKGDLVADGWITAVCCRIEPGGKPRSIPIPDEIRARLTAPVGEHG
jgi:4-hydroxybenzoyl-CoA thioesterase/acyl-CoA thioester hydrolase